MRRFPSFLPQPHRWPAIPPQPRQSPGMQPRIPPTATKAQAKVIPRQKSRAEKTTATGAAGHHSHRDPSKAKMPTAFVDGNDAAACHASGCRSRGKPPKSIADGFGRTVPTQSLQRGFLA